MGNPYPTAIDIDLFLGNNGNVNEIRLWNHNTPISGGQFNPSDYVIYNLSGGTTPGVTNNIGSSQGFMIRSISGGSVVFNNDYKLIDQNNQFFKSQNLKKNTINKDEKDRIWLTMTDVDLVKDNLLIGFFEESTDELDNQYDSYSGSQAKNISFYSQINEAKMSIQGLGVFSEDKTIELGFDSKISTSITLGISKTEGALKDSNIYLVDNLLGVTHNLKESDYQFEQSTTGNFPNRFTLQFAGAALDVDDVIANNEFIISNEFESLRINSGKTVNNIKIYDLLGRMLIQEKPNKKSFNLNTGTIKDGTVLLIEATLENGSIISRKTIKF